MDGWLHERVWHIEGVRDYIIMHHNGAIHCSRSRRPNCPTRPHRTPHPPPPPPPTPLPGKPLLAPSPTIAAYRHTVRTSSTAYLMDRTSESQIRHSFPFVTLPICPH